jgi:CxxC motif-containing protein (DUF1111 family)
MNKTIFALPLLAVSFLLYINADSTLASNSKLHSARELYPSGQHSAGQSKQRNSFDHPSPLLDMETKLDFKIGRAIFEKIWVFAPSSTTASDGLGPLYNARSCSRCHEKNGRGILKEEGKTSPALFLRLSTPAKTAEQKRALESGLIGLIPEPTYGTQLQTFAYPGGQAEAQLRVSYTEQKIQLSEGEMVSLRKPDYQIIAPQYGPMDEDLMISPRISSPMIGLGLIEAINEQDILSKTDPDDSNQDGISGKPNWVWDQQKQAPALGRFGWKAGTPNLRQQNASAFKGDLGISTPLFPQHWGDCTPSQTSCRKQAHGNRTRQAPDINHMEAPKAMTDALLLYTRNIAVPIRKIDNAEMVNKGKAVFHSAGCAACHTPSYQTSGHTEQASLNMQTIWPYTDLLLHDMGLGLADNRPEFKANGQEWRTAPLWGLGSDKYVNGSHFLLHDGRARSILEAIMWHGGEAESAKQAVQTMPQEQRAQLLTFLESL